MKDVLYCPKCKRAALMEITKSLSYEEGMTTKSREWTCVTCNTLVRAEVTLVEAKSSLAE